MPWDLLINALVNILLVPLEHNWPKLGTISKLFLRQLQFGGLPVSQALPHVLILHEGRVSIEVVLASENFKYKLIIWLPSR